MTNPISVPITKIDPNAIIPLEASAMSAGRDLYALINGDPITLWPGDVHLIHTGLAMAIPQGWFGAIFARSGIATRKGLRPANCVGVIDPDYRGEIMISLRNDSQEKQEIRHGDRVAQLVLIPYCPVVFEETDDLNDTERGTGGFGSTGE